jgi:hypothetical protein
MLCPLPACHAGMVFSLDSGLRQNDSVGVGASGHSSVALMALRSKIVPPERFYREAVDLKY